MIDHTLLKPEATEKDLQKVCSEAKDCSFKAVCVNSSWIQMVAENLAGTKTLPICVVGFPSGVCDTETKVAETKRCIQLGACEIDMVIHRGWLRQKDWSRVLTDIKAVKRACGAIPLKVILESHLLDIEEKIAATLLARAAGADFAKTCTGFTGGGATAEDVGLMRAIMGPQLGVKASGGVKTWEDAVKMIQAGANRIGTSSGVSIVSKQNSSGPSSY
ncbi:MAG: deoxyribose-phosphate aldolase [Bdellovibrionales bacterium]|nr:deoxyribose-phosphate aldolase [Bdellovibrionales bacterium]